MIRHIKQGTWDKCNVGNCGGKAGCIHEYIPFACPTCGTQLVHVKTSGFVFCPNIPFGDVCFEAETLAEAKEKAIPMVDGELLSGTTSPKRENGWYWVRRRPDRHSDETYWSIMYWDSREWSASGVEYPCYEDSDMAEIKPERLKAPDEQ